MNLVPSVIGRTVAHSALLAQRSSPGVLFGVGIVGMVGSTVLACRATLKMDAVLEETKDKLDTNIDSENRGRDVAVVYVQSSAKVVRLYAPAIILGGVSIAALTKSHNILNQRNAALTAAYAALEKGFHEYRGRVVERYGEETDRDLRYGTQQVEIVDPDTKKKKIVKRVGPGDPSIYARFFDYSSSSWSKEPEYNLIFLKCQQNYANDLLHARGHVFLNEVYDMLGLQRSKAGAVVGWILTPDGQTDNFINFGVFDDKSDKARDFVNGLEGSILLDFNVDGIIFDKIDMNREGEALSWQLNR
jgi:hypothetical protein